MPAAPRRPRSRPPTGTRTPAAHVDAEPGSRAARPPAAGKARGGAAEGKGAPKPGAASGPGAGGRSAGGTSTARTGPTSGATPSPSADRRRQSGRLAAKGDAGLASHGPQATGTRPRAGQSAAPGVAKSGAHGPAARSATPRPPAAKAAPKPARRQPAASPASAPDPAAPAATSLPDAPALAAPALVAGRPQRLRVVTWNINSVRLRLPLLAEIAAALEPDILCLQEIKVEDALFPLADLQALGFAHVAFRGMKAYNGVAILSRRLGLAPLPAPDWCGKGDSRHLAVRLDLPGRPLDLHNFYVPAGGDIPDPAANPKFAHKLDFVAEAARWFAAPPAAGGAPAGPALLVGDLNIAPLECDVWSHTQLLDVVSHTPVEVEALARWQAARGFVDAVRHFVPAPDKLYSWWSYRARDWEASDRGRRLDHVWVTPELAGTLAAARVLKAARGWRLPSDHVPVAVDLALG